MEEVEHWRNIFLSFTHERIMEQLREHPGISFHGFPCQPHLLTILRSWHYFIFWSPSFLICKWNQQWKQFHWVVRLQWDTEWTACSLVCPEKCQALTLCIHKGQAQWKAAVCWAHLCAPRVGQLFYFLVGKLSLRVGFCDGEDECQRKVSWKQVEHQWALAWDGPRCMLRRGSAVSSQRHFRRLLPSRALALALLLSGMCFQECILLTIQFWVLMSPA